MRILLVFMLSALIISCSKEKIIENKLAGTWNVNKVIIEDGEGFFFEDNFPFGKFEFSTSEKKCNALVEFEYMTYQNQTISDLLVIDSTVYDFDEKIERLFLNDNQKSYDFRILLLTKTDLQLEYYDLVTFRLKRFILEKEEK
jgi:hypothetical protein